MAKKFVSKRLGIGFYEKSAPEVAPLLLGKLICRDVDGRVVKYRITETECYYGEEDTACHAHKGNTPRTKIMYDRGGHAYVYLCYGMHHMFNVVCGKMGMPQGVLIRGVEGHSGPGRLTRALSIDKSLYGEDLLTSERLWIEDDGYVPEYETTPRIGIDYAAKEDVERLWRFVVAKEQVQVSDIEQKNEDIAEGHFTNGVKFTLKDDASVAQAGL